MTYIRKREEILNKFKVLMKEFTGKNISDEEIIEKCINYSIEHIKELLLEKNEVLDLNNDFKKKFSLGLKIVNFTI